METARNNRETVTNRSRPVRPCQAARPARPAPCAAEQPGGGGAGGSGRLSRTSTRLRVRGKEDRTSALPQLASVAAQIVSCVDFLVSKADFRIKRCLLGAKTSLHLQCHDVTEQNQVVSNPGGAGRTELGKRQVSV